MISSLLLQRLFNRFTSKRAARLGRFPLFCVLEKSRAGRLGKGAEVGFVISADRYYLTNRGVA